MKLASRDMMVLNTLSYIRRACTWTLTELRVLNRLRWCCRNLAVNFDQGGMPWTCLPGEPSNVNWCNSAQGEGLYKNPPQAWLGANDHGE